MSANVAEYVLHLRKKLEKGVGVEKTLHILRKLEKVQFTVELMKATGIGKIVRKLSKEADGEVAEKAKVLCGNWKRIVREASDNDCEQQPAGESNKYEDSLKHNSRSARSSYDPNANWSLKNDTSHKHEPSHDERKNISIKRESEEIKSHDSSHISNDHKIKETKNVEKKSDGHHSREGENSQKKKHDIYRTPSLLKQKPNLKPLNDLDILSDTPVDYFRDNKEIKNIKKNNATTDQFLGVTSRKGRTTVYSGHARTVQYTEVLRLEELCLRVLMDNIESITYMGCVPYYLIKPVLKKCTPEQLFRLEDYNPTLVEEDDELWFDHCQSEFRDQTPDEFESWRELYIRCQIERESKLKKITGNIKKSMSKSLPVRKTMLAFVDTAAKPPRSVLRKQEKFGTGGSVHFPEPGSTGKGHVAAMRAAAALGTSSGAVKVPNPNKPSELLFFLKQSHFLFF
ncbi:transcription elongation factor B polypeptide 3-like protein [Dinothrombium tinctorium]|uniref:Transcription elongation factor B polypeptide 3-like protein n=1 Tax=Dinothrombium tinctorium TaxID=1965070 RepID=A0A3S3PZJ2_9ACAR|nr:transcription elongation factor B polypeptide 3-like protein [Dinothrombium tinctorium]